MSYSPHPPPPPGSGGYATPQTNAKAVVALILGIVSLPVAFCCAVFGLFSIAAIILGKMAQTEIAASGGAQSGAGMAKAGFILGIVGTVLAVVMSIWAIYLISTGESVFQFRTY